MNHTMDESKSWYKTSNKSYKKLRKSENKLNISIEKEDLQDPTNKNMRKNWLSQYSIYI